MVVGIQTDGPVVSDFGGMHMDGHEARILTPSVFHSSAWTEVLSLQLPAEKGEITPRRSMYANLMTFTTQITQMYGTGSPSFAQQLTEFHKYI